MLTVEEVRARGITLPSDEDAAYGVIDEMEAWLASRIGPLDGPRSETFTDPYGSAILKLRRPTDAIVVVDDTVELATVALQNQAYLRRTVGYWGELVVVTYTPNDALLVRGVVMDLLRLGTTSETGFESETIGSYSYTRAQPGSIGALSRWALLRRLLPRQTFDSIPVRSGFDRPFPTLVVSSDLVTS